MLTNSQNPQLGIANLLLVSLALVVGCRPSTEPPVANPSEPVAKTIRQDLPAQDLTAAETLTQVKKAYAQATSYQDSGELHWEQLQGDQWVGVKVAFDTALRKPNQLALRCRGAHVVVNDGKLTARIYDPSSANYDNQVKIQPAPKTFTMAELDTDVELAGYIREPLLGGAPLPLLLLLKDPSIDKLLNADSATFLEDAELEGRGTFRRLQVQGLGGPRVLWLSPTSLTIARVDFPATNEDVPDATNGTQLGIRKISAVFLQAEINGEVQNDRFAIDVPGNATEVRYFVLPPVDFELPTPLFAKEVDEFSLTASVDGEADLTRKSLKGTHTVLLWFLRDEVSASLLKQVDAVYDKYKDNPKVRFCAISPEPTTIPASDLQAFLQENQIDLPLYRDTAAVGRDVFEIPGAPCIVVIDANSRVQAFRAGADPEAQDKLPQLLQELLANTNPAKLVREMIDQQYQQYAQQLAVAQSAGAGTLVDLAGTGIAPASKPERMKIESRWAIGDLKEPGNILIVPDSDNGVRLFVHEMADDWRTVVELNQSGQIVKRHQLPVPKDAAIAYLRTAVDKTGRRIFAGASRLGRQAFLFDESFRLLGTYPDSSQKHEGISDIALVHFDADDDLQLCVGFWGVLGVHGVGLDGKRRWTNRSVAPVVSLTSTPAHELGGRQVLATTDKGDIVGINKYGREDPAKRVDGFAVMHLYTSADAERRTLPYLGVALQQGGSPQGLALNEKFVSQWDIPLPNGSHRNQVQWVTSARLFETDAVQWIFAGPDGSVGIVADDVSFFDSFYYGKELAGIAATKIGDQSVLLLSSKGNVSAYNLTIPAGPVAP